MCQQLPIAWYGRLLSAIEEWTALASLRDRSAWEHMSRTAVAENRSFDLFDYLVTKAMERLQIKGRDGWGVPARVWWTYRNEGRWRRCLLFNHGTCNQQSQRRPMHSVHGEGVDVFPVVAFVVPGLELWVYYCPALAMGTSCLWLSHNSRFFEVPPLAELEQRERITAQSPVGSTAASEFATTVPDSEATAVSAAAPSISSSSHSTFIMVNGTEYIAVAAVSQLVGSDRGPPPSGGMGQAPESSSSASVSDRSEVSSGRQSSGSRRWGRHIGT